VCVCESVCVKVCVQKYRVQICRALALMQENIQLREVGIASTILFEVGILLRCIE
jgi:hypothetical protein